MQTMATELSTCKNELVRLKQDMKNAEERLAVAKLDADEVVSLRRKLRHRDDEIEAMKRIANREAKRLSLDKNEENEKIMNEQLSPDTLAEQELLFQQQEQQVEENKLNNNTSYKLNDSYIEDARSVKSITAKSIASSYMSSAFLFDDESSSKVGESRTERHARREERRRRRAEKELRRQARRDEASLVLEKN